MGCAFMSADGSACEDHQCGGCGQSLITGCRSTYGMMVLTPRISQGRRSRPSLVPACTYWGRTWWTSTVSDLSGPHGSWPTSGTRPRFADRKHFGSWTGTAPIDAPRVLARPADEAGRRPLE